jgi:hypothetical protein
MSFVGFTLLVHGPIIEAPARLPLRTSNWRDVACPRCGAEVGESCISPNGRAGRAHIERIKLADGAP